jgi:mRNA interferase MazF
LAGLKRGTLVVLSGKSDFDGKPRPAVIVQANQYLGVNDALTVCPLTSRLAGSLDLRVLIEPTPENGLRLPSEVQVDKVTTTRRSLVAREIGHLTDAQMAAISVRLRSWLDL